MLVFILMVATMPLMASALMPFVEYRALFDPTKESDLTGAELHFATGAMQDSVLAFDVAYDKVIHHPIRMFPMVQEEVVCRLEGYLDHCDHPFPEQGGTPGGHDLQAPFFLDFAITNEYIPPSPSRPQDLQHFPLFVIGVVPIFNVPGVRSLVLTPAVLAKIFRGCNDTLEPLCEPGSITMWSDPAIKATNPPATHPFLDAAGPIKLIVRADRNGATYVMKEALRGFETGFAEQIPLSDNSSWPGVDIHALKSSPEGVFEYVSDHPGTIGYVSNNFADSLQVGKVALISDGERGTSVVEADSAALSATMDNVGLAFGNDGRDPSELTIDLTVARSSRAWPLATLAYLVIRTNRTMDNCVAKMTELLDFLEYVYVNGTVQAKSYGVFSKAYAHLGDKHAREVLHLIRSSIRCDGEIVYPFPPPPSRIVVLTEQILRGSLEVLVSGFEKVAGSDIQVEVQSIQTRQEVLDRFQEDDVGYIVFADENLSADLKADDKLMNNIELMALPYAIASSSFIYNFCPNEDLHCTLNDIELVLDIETAAMMLDGIITMWNDTRIVVLNPNVSLPAMPIKLFVGPRTTDFHFDFIDFVRRDYLVDFAFAASQAVVRRTYADVYRSVGVNAFSFAYVPSNGTLEEGVLEARVRTRLNQTIPNSIASVEACASDTYDDGSHSFVLSASRAPGCYPMVDVMNLVTKRVYNTLTESATKTAVATARLVDFIMRKSIRKDASSATILTAARFGTLCDYKTSAGLDMALSNTELVKSILVNGERVLVIPQNMKWIPSALSGVMYAIMALELVGYAVLALWVIVHRNRKLVRNSSPTFMLQVLFGASLMSLTVVPLAQQDDFVSPVAVPVAELNPGHPSLDSACVAQPFLFSVGFFIVFSALFLKAYRLIRIFNNKKLKNLFLRDRQLLAYQAVVLLAVISLNLVWALYSPLHWHRFPSFIDRELGLVVSSSGLCFSPKGIYPAIPLVVGILIVLAIGNYLAYLGRRIPTEFNESKWTAVSLHIASDDHLSPTSN